MTLYGECEATITEAVARRPAPSRIASYAILGVTSAYLDSILSYAVGGPLGGLVEPLLVSYFSPVDEVFSELHGDPLAIAGAAGGYDDAAAALVAKAARVLAARDQSTQVWTGPAAEAFRRTLTELAALDTATAEALRSLAGDQLGAAATLAETKAAMTVIAGELQLATIRLLSQLAGVLVELAARAAIEFVRHFGETKEQFQENMIFEFARVLDEFYRPVLAQLTAMERSVCAEAGRILGEMAGLGDVLQQVASWLEAGVVSQPPAGDTGYAEAAGGNRPQAGDLAIVALMGAAGADDPNRIPPGYSAVTDPTALAELGLTSGMLDQDNGMQVRVYVDGQGRYVVVFPGTDFTDQRDVTEDFQGGGGVPAQTRAAIDIAGRIATSGHGGDVVFAGHSLGGRLASVAAMATDGTAVTYNPAGVDDATMNYVAARRGVGVDQLRAQADADQRAYVYQGEILDRIQTKDPTTGAAMPDNPGHRIDVAAPSAGTSTGVERHTDYTHFTKDLKAAYPGVFGP